MRCSVRPSALVALVALATLACAAAAHRCVHDHKVATTPPLPAEHAASSSAAVFEWQAATADVVDERHVAARRREAEQTPQDIRILLDTTHLNGGDPDVCTSTGQTVTVEGAAHVCGQSDLLTAAKRDHLTRILLPQAQAWLQRALRMPRLASLSFAPIDGRCTVGRDSVSMGATTVNGYEYVLHVSAKPEPNDGVLAWAAACRFDAAGRPTMGLVNFNPATIDTSLQAAETSIGTAIHEMVHALGFSSGTFTRPSLNLVQTFSERGTTVTKLTTPAVLAATRAHFGCPSANGAELENQGGAGTATSHLEKRLFRNEFMTGSSSKNPVYSAVTLALFEDLGWYTVNYDYTQHLPWGYQLGCAAVERQCDEWGSNEHYCTLVAQGGCSLDRTHQAQCNLATYTAPLPSEYQYFVNTRLGGIDQSADFCPFFQPYTNGDCTLEENGNSRTIAGGIVHGPDSMCFVGTWGGLTSGRCERWLCNSADELVVVLPDDGRQEVCTAGRRIPFRDGELLCPSDPQRWCAAHPDAACKTHNFCSGYGKCTAAGTCVCKPGFHGSDCSERVCPNACQPNGSCNLATGRCDCSSSQGFGGADCSDRLCPNNCSNRVGARCVQGKCECPTGFSGFSCEISSIVGCPNDCTGRGQCDTTSGTCHCQRGFAGVDCGESICFNGCAGNGVCDTNTGQCQCGPGRGGPDCTIELVSKLATGMTIRRTIAQAGQYHYYRMFIDDIADVTVTVATDADAVGEPRGNADLFISDIELWPTSTTATWTSTQPASATSLVDLVQIRAANVTQRLGPLYIAVLTTTENTAYTINASVACTTQASCEIDVECLTGCNGAGVCVDATGACLCDPDYSGVKCERYNGTALYDYNPNACLASSQSSSCADDGSDLSTMEIVILGLAAGSFVVFVLLFSCCFINRRNNEPQPSQLTR